MAIRNNIVANKKTNLFLLFHKNIKKLIFLWPNMNQKKLQSVNITFLNLTGTEDENCLYKFVNSYFDFHIK